MRKSDSSNMDPYQALANAIVQTAAEDYRAALKRLERNPENHIARHEANDIRKFFRSQWYEMLTDVDGEYLLRLLDAEHPAVYFPDE